MPTLDSQKRRVSIQQVRPYHRTYAPRVVVVVNAADPWLAAHSIHARVAAIASRQGTGAYVFIAPTLQAYVLAEDQSCAPQWLREHFAWLVGFYSRAKRAGIPHLLPTPQGIAEDIGEHLQQLGVA